MQKCLDMASLTEKTNFCWCPQFYLTPLGKTKSGDVVTEFTGADGKVTGAQLKSGCPKLVGFHGNLTNEINLYKYANIAYTKKKEKQL